MAFWVVLKALICDQSASTVNRRTKRGVVIDWLELPVFLHLLHEPFTVVAGAEDKDHGVLHVVDYLCAFECLNIFAPSVRQVHEPVLCVWLSFFLLFSTLVFVDVRRVRRIISSLHEEIVVFAVHIRHYFCDILLQVHFCEHLSV